MTNISKLVYLRVIEIIKNIKKEDNCKTIVLFGAGVMGKQMGYVMQENDIGDFIYCDNDTNKQRRTMLGRPIIDVEELIKNKEKVIVLITIEDSKTVTSFLFDKGFIENKDLWIIGNIHKEIFLKKVMGKKERKVFLGDCSLESVSLDDNNKTSLGEMLCSEMKASAISLNGLYLRQFYNIIMTLVNSDNNIDSIVLMLKMDVFNNRYHTYKKNQHYDIFKKIADIYNKSCFEKDFLSVIKSRSRVRSLGKTFKTDEYENDNDVLKRIQYLNLRLWYLQPIDKINENINYLKRCCNFCNSRGIKFKFVLLPHNYLLADEISDDTFGSYFERNKYILAEAIGNNDCFMDLSMILNDMKDFIIGENVGEGFRYNGRRKIYKAIINELDAKNN